MKQVLVTAPTSHVMTVKQALKHCHAEEGAEDEMIALYIRAAQSLLENTLGRAMTPQTWRLSLDAFPASSMPIMVPRPPMISIDSFVYTDSNGDEQALVGYVLNGDAEPALIYPPSTGWPSTDSEAHPAASITYTCGHDSNRPLDEAIRHFVYLFVGQSYMAREPVEVGVMISQYPHVWNAILGHPYKDRTDYTVQK